LNTWRKFGLSRMRIISRL